MVAKKNTKITNKSIFVSSTFRDMQARADEILNEKVPASSLSDSAEPIK